MKDYLRAPYLAFFPSQATHFEENIGPGFTEFSKAIERLDSKRVLLKMDIEGGELIVTPYLKDFLSKHKPVFYISLHFCFLKEEHVILITDILFDIYENCYYFTDDGGKIKISKEDVISLKKSAIVFE